MKALLNETYGCRFYIMEFPFLDCNVLLPPPNLDWNKQQAAEKIAEKRLVINPFGLVVQ
jgi:hypothetical protein